MLDRAPKTMHRNVPSRIAPQPSSKPSSQDTLCKTFAQHSQWRRCPTKVTDFSCLAWRGLSPCRECGRSQRFLRASQTLQGPPNATSEPIRPCISHEFHDILLFHRSQGLPWQSMGVHGFLWMSMAIHGFLQMKF